MKERIEKLKELILEIESRYYAYMCSGVDPNRDRELCEWIKERDEILDELNKEE